jgi:hypothetical protein
MAKTPVYHLEECNDCAHRNVCKFIDKIDKMLKRGDLPLDLKGASCHEYVPEAVIDPDWEDYMGGEEKEPEFKGNHISISFTHIEPNPDPDKFSGLRDFIQDNYFKSNASIEEIDGKELLQAMNGGIVAMQNQGLTVTRIAMNRETMNALKPLFNTEQDLVYCMLTNGDKVPIEIDDTIDTGYFAFDAL